MPTVQLVKDVASVSIGGSDQKAYLQSGTLRWQNLMLDGTTITDRHDRKTKYARSAELQVNLVENVSGVVRATLKDVSAFSLGGNSFAGYIRSLNFSRTCTHKSAMGDGTESTFPVWTKNATQITGELMVPLAAIPAFIKGFDTDGQAACELDLAFTSNGGTFTISAVCEEISMGLAVGDYQIVNFTLSGDAEATDPSGTSSLLAAAINAPETAVAISVNTKTTTGATFAGNGLVSQVGYQIREGQPTITNVTYASQGAWTIS